MALLRLYVVRLPPLAYQHAGALSGVTEMISARHVTCTVAQVAASLSRVNIWLGARLRECDFAVQNERMMGRRCFSAAL